MRKTKELFKILFIVSCLIFCRSSVVFATDNVNLNVGFYMSSGDEHKIEVKENGTILYDDIYTLIATEVQGEGTGYVLTGNLGTDSVKSTFYMINESNIALVDTVTYKYNTEITLLNNTVFTLDGLPSAEDELGGIELYTDGNKVGTYTDLQSAVDVAQNGSIIKITQNLTVNSGAIINKNITIYGENNILDKSNWANPLFVVSKGATLTIENLTIDGGATGFEVDYDNINESSYIIPLVENSEQNDPISNVGVISSSGKIITNNLEIKNIYTTNSGGGMNIYGGSAVINNSTFKHIHAKGGAAINIGTDILGNDVTEYPVEKITISNSYFDKNYASTSGGAAIKAYNICEMDIKFTEFTENTISGTGSYGGAIFLTYQSDPDYSSKSDAVGLPVTKLKIEDSLFEGNYCSNDGFAIQMYAGELDLKRTKLVENVGINSDGSVGTVSLNNYNYNRVKHVITDCKFLRNTGAVTGVGDHGSLVDISIYNTDFESNVGNYTNLMYYGNLYLDNCTYTDEDVDIAIDIRAYYTDAQSEQYFGVIQKPSVTMKNVTLSGTRGKDIVVRAQSNSLTKSKASVIVKENVIGNIDVWNNNLVIIEDEYTGDIRLDVAAENNRVTIGENGSVSGKIEYTNGFVATILYIDKHNENSQSFVYLQKDKIYTDKELYMMHFLGGENSKIEYYTNSNYRTKWNYSTNNYSTIYGKWVEHTHVYDEELSIYENTIYKQCECGYFEKCLKLEQPTNLVYDGNAKEVSVINTLELPETEYTLEYKQSKDSDGELLTSAPSNVGSYKAVLTTSGNKAIELAYEITKATPVITMSNLSQENVSITPVTYTITPEVTDGIVKIEYKESTAEDNSYTEVLPTAVGTYSVRVTLTGDSNLEDAEKIETLSITKRTSTGSSVTRYQIEVENVVGGTITPGTCKVSKGTNKTFKIKAYEGYEIEDVLVDGESVGAVSTYTFEKVNAKHTIEVKFKVIEDEEISWENPFKDVSKEDWFYEAVKYTNENKLMNGMSNDEFGGNISTTRGMIVTILYRYAKAETTEESTFDDVAKGSYYSNAIAWAAENDIVNGIGDNKFAPDAEITREQLVTILYRFAIKNGMDVSVGENTNILSYKDFNEISEYAIPAIQWACGSGIITGRTESTLCPKETANRAEVATMIMRFVNTIK